MASVDNTLRTFYNIANRAQTVTSGLNQTATRLHQLTTALTEPPKTQSDSYKKFSFSLNPANLEDARRFGKLQDFAAYLMTTLTRYEHAYFDDNGEPRMQPDTNLLNGYDADGLMFVLRNPAYQSLYKLANVSEEGKPRGLSVVPKIEEDKATIDVAGKLYPVFRLPQSLALMLDVKREDVVWLDVSSINMRQVYIDIKTERTENLNSNPTTIAESLIPLATEMSAQQLSHVVGRDAIYSHEWLLYTLRK